MFVLINTCTFVDQSSKQTSPPLPTHTKYVHCFYATLCCILLSYCTLQLCGIHLCYLSVGHSHYYNISSSSERVYMLPLIYWPVSVSAA